MLLAIKIWFGFLLVLLAVDLLIGQLFSNKKETPTKTRKRTVALKQASLRQAA